MRMKPMTAALTALLLDAAGVGMAAEDGSDGAAAESPQVIRTESGTEIIIRPESGKQRRDNSETHERIEPAGLPPPAIGAPEPSGGWYEPIFFWRSDDDAAPKTGWYERLFGTRNKDTEGTEGDGQDESRWWWPFD